MDFMFQVHLFLIIIAVFLRLSDGQDVCCTGQQADPSNKGIRWTRARPISDCGFCSKVLLGGFNTIPVILPYVDGLPPHRKVPVLSKVSRSSGCAHNGTDDVDILSTQQDEIFSEIETARTQQATKAIESLTTKEQPTTSQMKESGTEEGQSTGIWTTEQTTEGQIITKERTAQTQTREEQLTQRRHTYGLPMEIWTTGQTTGSQITVERTAQHLPDEEQSTEGQTIDGTTTSHPLTSRPTLGHPLTSRPTSGHPLTSRPISGHPLTSRPTTGHPLTSRPTSVHPLTSRPTTGHALTSRPTDRLSTEIHTTEKEPLMSTAKKPPRDCFDVMHRASQNAGKGQHETGTQRTFPVISSSEVDISRSVHVYNISGVDSPATAILSGVIVYNDTLEDSSTNTSPVNTTVETFDPLAVSPGVFNITVKSVDSKEVSSDVYNITVESVDSLVLLSDVVSIQSSVSISFSSSITIAESIAPVLSSSITIVESVASSVISAGVYNITLGGIHSRSVTPVGVPSGVHRITLEDAGTPVSVYCDMETDGGGWTVIQRRQDDSVDFFLKWNKYRDGFGDISGNFWLGNELIHKLTHQADYELRIDLEDFENQTRYALYKNFSIGDEDSGYKLTIGGFEGDAGDSLDHQGNAMFSTKDRDNDSNEGSSCANAHKGAWWYQSCHFSNLNGIHYNKGNIADNSGLVWFHWKGYNYSLKKVDMKIRPRV